MKNWMKDGLREEIRFSFGLARSLACSRSIRLISRLISRAARLGQTLAEALPGSHLPNFVEAARASLAGLRGINPTDPTEGMLTSQIIAAHEAAMHLRQLAWHPDQSFVVRTRYLELAEKAARTMAVLIERLDQHRSRGPQQITVR